MEHYFKKKIELPYPENDYCYVLHVKRTNQFQQITHIAGVYTDWDKLEDAVDFFFKYRDIDYSDIDEDIEFFVTTERFNLRLLDIEPFGKPVYHLGSE